MLHFAHYARFALFVGAEYVCADLLYGAAAIGTARGFFYWYAPFGMLDRAQYFGYNLV